MLLTNSKYYSKLINQPNSPHKNHRLSTMCVYHFGDIINKFKKDRQIEIKKQLHKKRYLRNKNKPWFKENRRKGLLKAKKNRNSKKHNNLKWILSQCNPNPENGTVSLPTYFNKKTGYMFCCILNRTYGIHRLIWMKANNKFITKELEINHIDFNKQNNKIENLEIVTHQQNIKWSNIHGRKAKSRFSKEELKKRKKQYQQEYYKIPEVIKRRKIAYKLNPNKFKKYQQEYYKRPEVIKRRKIAYKLKHPK